MVCFIYGCIAYVCPKVRVPLITTAWGKKCFAKKWFIYSEDAVIMVSWGIFKLGYEVMQDQMIISRSL